MGYFSRLVQQTGIAVGPTGGSISDALDGSVLRSKTSNIMPPMHEEAKESFQRSDWSIDNEKPIPRKEEESFGERPLEELQKQKTEEKTIAASHNRSDPATWKISESVREDSGNLKSESLQSGIEEIPGDDGDKNLDNEVHHSIEPFTRANKESTISTPPGSSDITSQKQTRQAYLKDVLEWVSEAPAVDEGIRYADKIEPEKREPSSGRRNVLPTPDIRSRKPQSYPINDFNLSIGTIRVTVEKPQEKIQNKEPPQKIEVESNSRRENESSRLSRHYIRI